MFIDELTLYISAGKGGDGIVSWRHEKGIDHAGPGGGDGGNGGDVYLKGVRDIARLSEYRFEKSFRAANGQNGLGNGMHGKSGTDLIIELPLGSVVTNTETGESTEIMTEDPILFLKGGKGGYGNEHFKGPTNVRPRECSSGKHGEGGTFFVELKMVADVGLIGLPNAGKTSLLNSLTKAKAKVGGYQFTTLAPNLGDLYGFIIADIPGLIEGASEGKGLGYKFLRHISRTKTLLHCVSCENSDLLSVYKIVRNELEEYDPVLLNKPEIILLTKTDLIDEKTLRAYLEIFKNLRKETMAVSVIDDMAVKTLSDWLVKTLRKM